MVDPRVKVLILTYNDESQIEPCLDSMLNQTYDNYEILVGDNASTDSTLEILEEYEREYDRLRVVEFEENTGFCEGNNRLYERVDAPLVSFANSDVIVKSDWLETLVSELTASDDLAVAVPDLVEYEEYPEEVGGGRPVFFSPEYTYLVFGETSEEPVRTNFAAFTACVAKTNAIDELDYLLDERLWMYCDDLDFSIRLYSKGYDFVYVPDSVVFHPLQNVSLLTAYQTMRNIHPVIYKNFGAQYYFDRVDNILFHNLKLVHHFSRVHEEDGPDLSASFRKLGEAWVDGLGMLSEFDGDVLSQAERERVMDPPSQATPSLDEIVGNFEERILLHG